MSPNTSEFYPFNNIAIEQSIKLKIIQRRVQCLRSHQITACKGSIHCRLFNLFALSGDWRRDIVLKGEYNTLDGYGTQIHLSWFHFIREGTGHKHGDKQKTEQARRLPVCTSSLYRRPIATVCHDVMDGRVFRCELFIISFNSMPEINARSRTRGAVNHPTTQSF